MRRSKDSRPQTTVSCSYQFMKTESEEAVSHDSCNFLTRAVFATGMAASTIKNAIDETKQRKHRERILFKLPINEISGRDPRTCTKLDIVGKGVLKRLIYKVHAAEKSMPSMIKLLAKLKQEINYNGSTPYLRSLIKSLGFIRYKNNDEQDYYSEKPNTRLSRIEYLQNIKKFRNEGRPIIFTNVAYVAAPGVKKRGPKNPNCHGVVLAYAGSELGLVAKATTIFKNFAKQGAVVEFDYEHFEEWVCDCLLPNIPENSVVVLLTGPYNEKILNAAPTQRALKTEMEKWLRDMGVPFEPTMKKPQLSKLINRYKNIYESYAIDDILKENNHAVLRLPPYHPDLNPLKLVWETNEHQFGKKPLSNHIKDLLYFVLNNVRAIHNVGNLKTYYEKVTEIEDHYRICDSFIDNLTDEMQPEEYDTTDTDSEDDGEIILTDTDDE